MDDLRAELAGMMDEAEWDWLAPHARRNALLVVDIDLDLLEVGVAIANDNVSSVQHWVNEQLVYKPSTQQVSDWNNTPTRRFTALIVQPYVLIQAIAA